MLRGVSAFACASSSSGEIWYSAAAPEPTVSSPPPTVANWRCRSTCRDSVASSPPLGCQMRRKPTATASETREAMMSVISTEIQVAEIHWVSAKVMPMTSAAGQVWRMPRLPSTMATSSSGTKTATTGAWCPT